MKPEIQKVIDAWKLLASEINKYASEENPEAFSISFENGEYILNIDMGVFDENGRKLHIK